MKTLVAGAHDLNHTYSDSEITPLFFSDPSQPLFGCCHIPNETQAKSQVVVICSPIGQEYIRSHRTVFQLANRLAQAGFYVLRFDYFGCGDSFGEFEDGSLSIWEDNINGAIEFILKRSGSEHITLIGLRLGATLALKAIKADPRYDQVVLWEPILNGPQYLEEMLKSHQSYTRHLIPVNKRYFGKSTSYEEILGFQFNPELIEELEGIQHDQIPLNPNMAALLVCNSETPVPGSHYEDFCKAHGNVELKLIKDHQSWEERIYKRLIPFNTIKYIVQWINKRHP